MLFFNKKEFFSSIFPQWGVIMRKNKKERIMKNNSIVILFTTTIFGLISYSILNNATVSLLVLLTGAIFLYISKKNNKHRKENLNIIRDEDKLYFYLSDDLLFSVDLPHNQSITEILRESINNEITTIKNITRKICFINFKEDALLEELNRTIISNKSY